MVNKVGRSIGGLFRLRSRFYCWINGLRTGNDGDNYR